jgi:hypothetical protein
LLILTIDIGSFLLAYTGRVHLKPTNYSAAKTLCAFGMIRDYINPKCQEKSKYTCEIIDFLHPETAAEHEDRNAI